METNVEGIILVIPEKSAPFLRQIRHWDQLLIAFAEAHWWIAGVTKEQLGTKAIATLPFQKVYTLAEGLLYPYEKLLPTRKLPRKLEWATLTKGLPLERPKLNHNYFGLFQQLPIHIQPSTKTQVSAAILTKNEHLLKLMQTYAGARMENLTWCLVSSHTCFVMGTPILSLPGQTFWRSGQLFLPTGFDLNQPLLRKAFEQKLKLEEETCYVWPIASAPFLISAATRVPLSRSSVRMTLSVEPHLSAPS